MIKYFVSLSIFLVILLAHPFKAINEQEYSKLKGQTNAKSLDKIVDYQPEQIHIAYGSFPTQMIITWTTLSFVNDSIVEYGIDKLTNSKTGKYQIFKNKDKDFTNREETIHSVLLTDLIPGQRYSKNAVSFNFYYYKVYFSKFLRVSRWVTKLRMFTSFLFHCNEIRKRLVT